MSITLRSLPKLDLVIIQSENKIILFKNKRKFMFTCQVSVINKSTLSAWVLGFIFCDKWKCYHTNGSSNSYVYESISDFTMPCVCIQS